jgi:hypothetical protein
MTAEVLIAVLAMAPAYEIDSIAVRYAHYDQHGLGYQSAAGLPAGPGSEDLTVEQPQVEVVARVGPRITELVAVPVDVITAASPNHRLYGQPVGSVPVDAISSASRVNEAAEIDSTTIYRWDHRTDVSFQAGYHMEEPFESWTVGLGVARSFADDNTVAAMSLVQVLDWFDRFTIAGQREGRAARSSTNVNLTLTQVLSPYALGSLSYGGTVQLGTLGNTWSSVPLTDGTRGDELLPRARQRHALAARLAEWLPWGGALKLRYRFYLDDWAISAHTAETDLAQRITPWLRVQLEYRYHRQSAARFFTIDADPQAPLRTADSDLARFTAQTLGGSLSVDVPLVALRAVHVDVGYERYFRSNHLTMDIVSCGFGLSFW